MKIKRQTLPSTSIAQPYLEQGYYVDCFCTKLPSSGVTGVTLAELVTAFYTSRTFAFERGFLRWVLGLYGSDQQIIDLAHNQREEFCGWTVAGRDASTPERQQLLMRDFMGRTYSWFMVETNAVETNTMGTTLYFGTVAIPIRHRKPEPSVLGWLFWLSQSGHRLYARLLLRSTAKQLITK